MNKEKTDNVIDVKGGAKASSGYRSRNFFTDVRSELRRVEWPNREHVVKSTALVLIVVSFFIMYVSSIDAILGKIFYWLKLLR